MKNNYKICLNSDLNIKQYLDVLYRNSIGVNGHFVKSC